MANVVSDEVYNQLKQMYWWNASKASRAKAQLEIASASDYDKMIKQLNSQYGSSTSSSTPKTTTTSTPTPKSNTVTETYRWQVSDGTSNMNSMSQTAAKSNSRDFQVGTGDVAEMPEQPKVSSVKQPAQDNFAKSWNSLSSAQQQAALTKKGMLDYVNSKWLTVKKEETPVATTTKPKQTTYTTPKQQEWDYQDNSQARMDEIARNLNWFRQTNPELFQDPSTFYGFFIDGKGRSQDQIDYLWSYYDRVKKYSKYDDMPASSLWEWLADGSVPQDYLDYIKWVDPQKYQEILSYKQDWEDRIKNESYLEDLSSMAWFEWWESEPSSIQYGKWNWIWLDENGDWIDDRRYHAPTEEELQLSQEDSEYEAEKLKLKNAYKWLQDDLTEQYPDADLSTIMVLTSDRGTKIQKALDTISVAQTKTQWRLAYLQNERATMDKAWADSIAQLQKNLWMYYQYSPEWIAELAQAQYWATNITLDQADSWTETQKQMALQNVLDWYYDKYWDIIQRSEQQVINDVIAYAKEKWIWLAQALQENFVQPLQSKPWFAQLNATTSDAISWTKIWEDADWNAIYGFVDTYNKTVTPYWNASSSWISTTYDTSTRPWKANTVKEIVSYDWTDDLGWAVSDIYNKFKWQNYWECWYLVNDYYKAVTWDSNNLITGTFKDRKGLFTKNTPSVWDIVLFDWTNSPTASDKMKTYWHVALVEWMDDTGIWVVDANWDWNWTVDRRHINYNDALYQDRVYWFYTIPEWDRQDTAVVDMWYINTPEAINAFEEFNKLWSKWLDTTAKQKRAKELFALLGTDENGFKRMADAYWDDQNAQQAEKNIEMIDKLLATADDLPDIKMRSRLWTPNSYWTLRNQADWWYWTLATAAIESMDEEELAAYNKWASDYDMLMANLMYDKYKEIKSTWWTFWSMSNAEWDNLKQAASNLKFNQDVKTYRENLEALKKEFQNLKWYGAWKASTKKSLGWANKTSTMNSLLDRFSSY